MEIKDVKKDGNCLLWAVMVSYLEQVKTNKKQFKKRYTVLFGIEMGWERIFNFADFNFFDKENEKLVKIFRDRICNYIKKNLATKRPNNKADFRSMLLDSEINKKNKKLYPNNSEEEQIRITLEQMRKNGEITGSVEIEAICNILNCDIIRINESFTIANGERFEPDAIIATNQIKLYYHAGHYQYFSNVTNKVLEKKNEEKTAKVVTSSVEVNSSNNSCQEDFLFPIKQNDDFLINAKLKLKNQLSDKEINEETQNAIINIFIEDIIKKPSHQRNKILEKSIFELNNQDRLFANPNLVFESFIKLVVNDSKTDDQQLSKEVTNTNTN